MEFLDIMSIAERQMDLLNPTSAKKVVRMGELAGLKPGRQVIDFGCGFGEALAVWGEYFAIGGVGIDLREYACQRARQRLVEAGQSGIKIVCAHGAEYQFKRNAYDLAACLGASFIWGGFSEAIRAMRTAIGPQGRLLIGESFLRQEPPEALRAFDPDLPTEWDLVQMARQAGFELMWVIRSSEDEWDRYVSGNWSGLLHWIAENPDDPDRPELIDFLHADQDEYFRFGRKYRGWAMFLLQPAGYG